MKAIATYTVLFTLCLFRCHAQTDKINYPPTRTVSQENTYFGTTVKDPYRWLENDTAKETAAWVAAENKVTFDYLAKIPFRDAIKDRLTKLWNYEKYSAPLKEGDLYFFARNDGLQNQAVEYVQKGKNGTPEVLLDPNTLTKDGTAAVSAISFTRGGKYMGFGISRSGSDWQELYVMDVASKKLLPDTIMWAKFTGLAWKGEGGFYYSRYDTPQKGEEMKASNVNQKVYYHKLGTPQSADPLIYADPAHPNRYVGVALTEDYRFLCLYASEGTSGTGLYIKDLSQKTFPKENYGFKTVVADFVTEHSIIDNVGDELILLTNMNAPNRKIVRVNAADPTPAHWQELIGEQAEVIDGVSTCGEKLFLSYLKDAHTQVFQYDYTGKKEREIVPPAPGSVGVGGGYKSDRELFYTFTSFTFPNCIYAYDVASSKSSLFRQPQVDFKPEDFETTEVFYPSKDNTPVHMFIVHKKGLKLNGHNPTLLYAYGGFNISETPYFSVTDLFWLEKGGVYAVPNLRGGGEYGEKWHHGGWREHKQNVFNDFIAAGEYLVKEKYTSKNLLAIQGGSNGGLLIGATLTQRPDLARVALAQVGVMDMLRFHLFTVGKGWITEYGCADSSKAQFETLYHYSPLHNLKPGTAYPATMITTADHDDRVFPAHSFKFAAEIQHDQAADAPVLIRIDSKAGHGAGKPTGKRIEEAADLLSFTYYNMGIYPFAGH